MKISLNEIVSILASRVGQQWNADLMEEMKVVVNIKRSNYFKRLLEAHPEQRRFFYKGFSTELLTVDKTFCPIDVDCDVLRTEKKIPQPVRTTEALFDYIGTPDGQLAFGYALPENAKLFSKYNRYTSTSPKYFYVNGYVYIYNTDDLESITVRGVFDDPRELSPFKCAGDPCYTDNDQYDIPSDLIDSIIERILQVELRGQAPIEGEVRLDKSDKKTEQGGPTVSQ